MFFFYYKKVLWHSCSPLSSSLLLLWDKLILTYSTLLNSYIQQRLISASWSSACPTGANTFIDHRREIQTLKLMLLQSVFFFFFPPLMKRWRAVKLAPALFWLCVVWAVAMATNKTFNQCQPLPRSALWTEMITHFVLTVGKDPPVKQQHAIEESVDSLQAEAIKASR